MRTALIFPGQGSQRSGMGTSLLKKFPYVHAIFEEAGDVAGFNVADLLTTASADVLLPMVPAQISVFTINAVYCTVLEKETGWKAQYAAGNSLGELSALHYAGVFDFAAGLKLVLKRAGCMDMACKQAPGKMLAVSGADKEAIEAFLLQAKDIWLSGQNTETQWILSGRVSAIEDASRYFTERGMRPHMLQVGAACHCPLMASAKEQWMQHVADMPFRRPGIQVVSSLTGKPYPHAEAIKQHLLDQRVEPTCWHAAAAYLKKCFCQVFIETGQGSTYTDMFKRQFTGIKTFAISRAEERCSFSAFRQAHSEQEKTAVSYDHPIAKLIRILMGLPAAYQNESAYLEAKKNMEQIHQLVDENMQYAVYESKTIAKAVSLGFRVCRLKGCAEDVTNNLLQEWMQEP